MSGTQIDATVERFPALAGCRVELERAFALLRETYIGGGKVLLCGNGGSAADAEHWAGELLKGFRRKRELPEADRAKLPPDLAQVLQGALPAIPLTGFLALSSAFANDVASEFTFAQLVWGLGEPGDVLVGISTSGNAQNVCAALERARARGLRTLGLTGENGGAMGTLCDVSIKAPARETYRVQECHLPMYHCLSLMLEEEFFRSKQIDPHGGSLTGKLQARRKGNTHEEKWRVYKARKLNDEARFCRRERGFAPERGVAVAWRVCAEREAYPAHHRPFAHRCGLAMAVDR